MRTQRSLLFFILLSLIPFLMVFSSLLRYTPITEETLIKIYHAALPEYLSGFLGYITNEVYNRSVGIVSITAVVAIWSAAKGIQYLTDGLNSVNDLEENRNWFTMRLWAVVYTVGFLVAFVFVLGVLVFGNTLHNLAVGYIPVIKDFAEVLAHFRGLVLLGILFVFFVVIFTTLPNKNCNSAGRSLELQSVQLHGMCFRLHYPFMWIILMDFLCMEA